MDAPLRVIVLSVSSIMGTLVGRALENDPDTSVLYAGVVSQPIPKTATPDVLILDIDASREDDLRAAALRRAEIGAPTLVMSATFSEEIGERLTAAGFTTARRRLDLHNLTSTDALAPLVKLLRAVARGATVTRAPAEPQRDRPVPPTASSDSPAPRGPTATHPRPVGASKPWIVAVGASTGGPQAVKRLLVDFPPDPRWAVVIVQHISAEFAPGYARWLSETTEHDAHIAVEGEAIRGGTTVVSPGGVHLLLDRATFHLDDGPKHLFQKPSVDLMFQSVARAWGERVVGILLTGMGRDGGLGCRAIVDAGGVTLVQDEASSVVYGMPKAAVDAGGATHVLPIDEIGMAARRVLDRLCV